jgi:hypothetical protein
MPSALRHGEVLLDNRLAPPTPGVPKFVEGRIYRCNHCETGILKDPGVEPEWCYGCDRYLCKRCKALSMVSGCKPYMAVIEEFDRLAHKGMTF